MDRQISFPHIRKWLPLFLSALAILLGVSLFGRVLVGKSVLAFRDISHFYHPLQIYLQSFRGESWFPLWSPLDSFGVPLAGETTTATFYPPRILLSLCFAPHVALGFYILIHLFMAGAGTYRLARNVGSVRAFAAIAAFGYALSGCVFFLYTNPPLLVGAAWLPWTVLYLHKQEHASHITWSPNLIRASCCIALSILGGDPQTPINILLLYTMRQCWLSLCSSVQKETASKIILPWFSLALVCVLAVLLSLPQLAASLSWSTHSHRHATQPKNLFTTFKSDVITPSTPLPAENEDFEIQQHADQINRFSIAPWHLIELLSPYASGKLYPINGRISKVIPNEPGMWTPTLYCGFLPGLCFFVAIFRRSMWDRWLLLAVLSMLFAAGSFGIYWLLVEIVPGYGQFRFPAKWLPLAALGIVVNSAVGLTHYHRKDWLVLSKVTTAAIIIGSLLSVLFSIPAVEQFFVKYFDAKAAVISDRFWGPLNLAQGFKSLRLSILQSTIIAGGLFVAIHSFQLRRVNLRTLAIVFMGLSFADNLLSARWQLTTVSAPALLAGAPHANEPTTESHPNRYILSKSKQPWPRDWRGSSDLRRFEQVERAQRLTWFSRWHLADNVAILNNPISVPANRAVVFWAALNAHSHNLSSPQHRSLLDKVASYLSVDAYASREQGQLVFIPTESKQTFIRFRTDWELVPHVTTDALPTAMLNQIARIGREGEDKIPQVEVASTNSENILSRRTEQASGSISRVQMRPERMNFQVSTDGPGLVQIMQMQEGGWHAYLRPANASGNEVFGPQQTSAAWKETMVHPTDLISQGFFVPAGNWEATVVYQPAWLWPCGLFTMATWLVIGCSLGWRLTKPRDERL